MIHSECMCGIVMSEYFSLSAITDSSGMEEFEFETEANAMVVKFKI